jgi:hypothetical protein
MTIISFNPNIYECDMPCPQYRMKRYVITSLQKRGEMDEQTFMQTDKRNIFLSNASSENVWLYHFRLHVLGSSTHPEERACNYR